MFSQRSLEISLSRFKHNNSVHRSRHEDFCTLEGEAAISNASCAAACTADSKCSAFAVDRDTVEVKCLVYNETAKGCELQGAAMPATC